MATIGFYQTPVTSPSAARMGDFTRRVPQIGPASDVAGDGRLIWCGQHPESTASLPPTQEQP